MIEIIAMMERLDCAEEENDEDKNTGIWSTYRNSIVFHGSECRGI